MVPIVGGRAHELWLLGLTHQSRLGFSEGEFKGNSTFRSQLHFFMGTLMLPVQCLHGFSVLSLIQITNIESER